FKFRYPDRWQPVASQHMPSQLFQHIVGIAVIVLIPFVLDRLLHLCRSQYFAIDTRRLCLIAKNESATGSLIGHHHHSRSHLLASSLHLQNQPCSTCIRIYEPKSLALFQIHSDSCHRVLVSKINSYENMLIHWGQSPFSFRLCVPRANSEIGLFFLHSELLEQEGWRAATGW